MAARAPPKVSVCIPTFNYGRFLRDALDSALSQSWVDLELVVVDNCSTDETPRIVEEYAARDPRVRYVRNAQNLGAQRNLNRCIELAAGDYVQILCADDLLAPTAVEALARALDAHPGAALAGCARVVIDGTSRPRNVLRFSGRTELVPGPRAVRRCLMAGNRIGEPSAVMFRRREAQRGFDTRYRQLIDLEMWFHLLQKGGFAFVAEPLCTFRVHEASESSKNTEALGFIPEFRRLVESYAPGERDLVLRHRWRLHLAFEVWKLQLHRLSFAEAHRAMRDLYPLPLFYCLLPSELWSEVRDAIHARWTMRALSGQARGGPAATPNSATRP